MNPDTGRGLREKEPRERTWDALRKFKGIRPGDIARLTHSRGERPRTHVTFRDSRVPQQGSTIGNPIVGELTSGSGDEFLVPGLGGMNRRPVRDGSQSTQGPAGMNTPFRPGDVVRGNPAFYETFMLSDGIYIHRERMLPREDTYMRDSVGILTPRSPPALVVSTVMLRDWQDQAFIVVDGVMGWIVLNARGMHTVERVT